MEIMRIEKDYGITVLNDVVSKIRKAADDVHNKEFVICMQLTRAKNEVSDNEYDDTGFKDFRAWAKDAFGMSESTAYNYAKIGEHVNEIRVNKTKKIYRFDLWSVYCEKSGEIYNENCDFTIGQIISMMRKDICYDDMLAMCLEGIVSPTMSCRDIKSAVKKWYNGEIETETDETNNEESESGAESETDENSESDVIECDSVLIDVWTEDGTKYRIPESVLKYYIVEE